MALLTEHVCVGVFGCHSQHSSVSPRHGGVASWYLPHAAEQEHSGGPVASAAPDPETWGGGRGRASTATGLSCTVCTCMSGQVQHAGKGTGREW